MMNSLQRIIARIRNIFNPSKVIESDYDYRTRYLEYTLNEMKQCSYIPPEMMGIVDERSLERYQAVLDRRISEAENNNVFEIMRRGETK